jgi:hypothetical protein
VSTDETWIEDPTQEVPPGEDGRRYEPRAELGRGAMGIVEAVYDRRLERVVARKSLRGPGARGFRREARVAAALEHPGIVPIYDASDGPDGPWYTMRRIEGRSLKEGLADAATLEDRLALVTPFLRLCEAMAYAHDNGVLHRDLKPANVMLGAFGEVVVVDFGLATPTEEATGGRIAGTPAYMSPEAARGQPATPRTDVWSLGAILYEILAGRRVWQGPAMQILEALRTQRPEPLVRVVPDAPPELVAIVNKAMQADPAERYPDAGALRADVEAFANGRLVGAYRYSRGELLRRFVQQYRGYIALSLAAVGVVAAVTGVAVWRIELGRQRAVEAEKERTAQLARAIETQARSLGGSLAARDAAQRALALDPTLPWARGVLSEFAMESVAEPDGGVDATACGWGALVGEQVVLHCADDFVLVDPVRRVVLDRLSYDIGNAYLVAGPDWVAAPGTHTLMRVRVDRGELVRGNVPCRESDDIETAFLAVGPEGGVLHGTTRRSGEDLVIDRLVGEAMVRSHSLGAVRAHRAVHSGAWQILWHTRSAWLCDRALRNCERIAFPGVVQHVLWSQAGRRALLVSTSGEAYVFDLATRSLALLDRAPAGAILSLAAVGDEAVAVLLANGSIEIFDTGGSRMGVIDARHLGPRHLVAVDDRLWVVGMHGTAIWTIALPDVGPVVRFANGIGALHAGPNGVFVAHDDFIFRIDGRAVEPVYQADSLVKDLDSDGSRLWVGLVQPPNIVLEGSEVVGTAPRRGYRRVGHANGLWVGFGYDDRIHVDGERTDVDSVGDMSTGGTRVILENAPGRVQVREVPSMQIVWEHDFGREGWALALSPDGRQAAIALDDHRVRTVDLETGTIRELQEAHESFVAGLAFSPSGRRLASASWDGTSRVWEDGVLLAALEAHIGRVTTVSFESDDVLYTGSWDKTLRRWDLTAWETTP